MRRSYRKRLRILIVGSLSVFAATLFPVRQAASQEGWCSLQVLHDEIVRAISDARELADQPPYLLITKVDLTLKGTKKFGGEGGFSIPVFGAAIPLGVKGATSANEVLKMALAPAESIVVGGGAPEIDLSGLIAGVKEAFRAKKGKNPMFIIQNMQYETSWTLQYQANGGIKLVIANAEVSISDEKQQMIRFTLCETKNLRDCAAQ
jgi:hypothetical protein